MKINKYIDEKAKRIKLAEGEVNDEQFAVSLLLDGSAVVVEFEKEIYSIEITELIKEIIKRRKI